MNNKQYLTLFISKQYCIKFGLIFVLFLYGCFLGASNTLAQDANFNGLKITSPITGIISKVFVEKDQSVKKGDLLLEYDASLIVSNLNEAKAKIKLATLNRAEAKKEFERAEELFDRTVLSEQELQQAKILYSKASTQYAIAKNNLIHAQWNLDHSKLYATFSGKVIQVLVYPGQYINNKLTTQTLFIIK
ncbi:MAG: biotin/lipoyl-binding protein [Gammaproteobacteria bacterium]|nr:biotin/lipoyl-binding protein [Gammaproteobacteria bacterium]